AWLPGPRPGVFPSFLASSWRDLFPRRVQQGASEVACRYRPNDRGNWPGKPALHSFPQSASAHPARAISRFCMADRGWLLAATHNRKRAFANSDLAMDVDPRGLRSPRDLRSPARVPRSPSAQNPSAYRVHETVGVDG